MIQRLRLLDLFYFTGPLTRVPETGKTLSRRALGQPQFIAAQLPSGSQATAWRQSRLKKGNVGEAHHILRQDSKRHYDIVTGFNSCI